MISQSPRSAGTDRLSVAAFYGLLFCSSDHNYYIYYNNNNNFLFDKTYIQSNQTNILAYGTNILAYGTNTNRPAYGTNIHAFDTNRPAYSTNLYAFDTNRPAYGTNIFANCTNLDCPNLHCAYRNCSDIHCAYRNCSDIHCAYRNCSDIHCAYRNCSDLHCAYRDISNNNCANSYSSNYGKCLPTPSYSTADPVTNTYSTQPVTNTYSTQPVTNTYSTRPVTFSTQPVTTYSTRPVTYTRRTYSTPDPPLSRSTYSADENNKETVTPAGIASNISANLVAETNFHDSPIQAQLDDIDDIELQTGPDNYDVKLRSPLENGVCLQQIDKDRMAPLIYNAHQPGITTVSASLPSEQCACSRNFNIHFHQTHNDEVKNTAWRAWKDVMFFDLRTNSECQRLCVCTMAGKCFMPNESAKTGGISLRFSADCSVSPCLMRAVLRGTANSPAADGACLVEKDGAKKCAFNVGQSFDAVALSCNGCPSQKVLKCAEYMAR
ncbi:hypothetical protein niasHS_005124 [Heterodera schachtii]|uniref:Uncharacterized protein n=1 Tax=Heterodera schachtii TaxID=97005 RepID=A0ABD2JT15_HETSC